MIIQLGSIALNPLINSYSVLVRKIFSFLGLVLKHIIVLVLENDTGERCPGNIGVSDVTSTECPSQTDVQGAAKNVQHLKSVYAAMTAYNMLKFYSITQFRLFHNSAVLPQ